MSLFGWREKRKNEQLQRRIEQLIEQRDDARKLAGIHQGNLVRMAQARAALHDENVQLRRDVDVAEGVAARYRLVWLSARRRVVRARHDLAVQHRVNDRLSDQLMDSMGYSDVALMKLGVDLADTKAGEPA